MKKFLSLAFVFASFVTLAACSSTVTGSTGNATPETDAAPQADTAIVEAGNPTRPDVNAAETVALDSAQPDASMRDALVVDASDASPSDAAVTTIVTGPVTSTSLAGIRYGLWYHGQTFTVYPGSGALRVERVRVRLIGNSHCVDHVAIVAPPDVLAPIASGVLPASTSTGSDPPSSWADLVLPSPASIPLGGRELAIAVQWVAPVDPAVAPTGCHPGDVVQIGLDQRTITGEWDSTYTDSFNVRMVGASGEVIRATAPLTQAMNSFRMGAAVPFGQPIIELATPSSLALTAGTHEVRYAVRSTALPISVKKVEIFFRARNADGATPWHTRWRFPLTGTRFLRDGVEVDSTTYSLVGWAFPMAAGVSSVTVEWWTEEVVSMAGHSYSLIVPITGMVDTGDSVEVSLYSGNSTAPIERGRLTPNGSNFGLYHVPGPHVWVGSGMCMADTIVWDGNVRPSSFVWSDHSGRGHTTSDCTIAGASDDWFTRAMTITGGTYTLTAR